jgi:hypothetical protein
LSLDPPRSSWSHSTRDGRNVGTPSWSLDSCPIRVGDMWDENRSWKLNRVCYFRSDQCVIRRIEQFQKQRANSRAFKDLTKTHRGDLAKRSWRKSQDSLENLLKVQYWRDICSRIPPGSPSRKDLRIGMN